MAAIPLKTLTGGGGLSSLQRGSTTFQFRKNQYGYYIDNSLTQDVTISPVDPSKTTVNLTGASCTTAMPIYGSLELLNSTTLRVKATRGASQESNLDAFVTWEIIEGS
jgi:hypothetical protein